MTQTIKIKRSTGSAAPATLAQGELAYSKTGNKLYVGDPATVNTPIQVNDLTNNASGTLPVANGGTGDTTASGARTNLGLGSLATKSAVGAAEITDNTVGAAELNVSGNGSSGQSLVSDGSGGFTWTTITGDNDDVSTANLIARLDDISSNVTIGDAADVTVTTSGNLTVTGNLTVSGTTTTVNSETLTIDDNIIVLNDNVTGAPTENAGIEINRGTSTNVLFRYNETNDRWEFTNNGSTYYNIPISSEYTNNSGDITGVTAGTGLSGGGASGSVTLNVDLSELTDMTADVNSSQDELILLDNGADRRKKFNEIPINAFRTSGASDLEFEDNFLKLNQTSTITNQNGGIYVARSGSNQDAVLFWDESEEKWKFGKEGMGNSIGVGDITSVAAGVGLSGGGTSGAITVTLDMSELTDMTATINRDEDEIILLDNGSDRRKLIKEIPLSAFNNDSGFTTNTGDITSVAVSSTDGSITGTGTANSGAASFDLEVGTIDGGTY